MLGQVIGSYRILKELGAGGMGTVYLAKAGEEGEGFGAGARVALKVIHANLVESEGFFRRFQREAEIGRRVAHANVVRTYAARCVEVAGASVHFLVMEYVEGQTLRGLLAGLGRVPEELCLHIGHEVAAGLHAIHAAGIVHRDLKPENVMITPDHVVKVMDLGVAKLKDEALRLSRTGQFVGSLQYAAPEQFRSQGEGLDGRSDLHALGVILYELATGTHPFASDAFEAVIHRVLHEAPRKISELNPQVSPFFECMVGKLLEKPQDERFPSAEAVLEVVEAGEEGAWWKDQARVLRAATRRPLRRIRIPRETALYGRDTELATLRQAFELVSAGNGQVVLLEGEAGVGKTRLVDEFLGELERGTTDVDALLGGYLPGGAATAAGAFLDAWRERLGNEDLEPRLAELLEDSPLLAPAVAALLRGEGAPPGAAPLTQDALRTALVGLARALSRSRPVVMLIDDLQFAPPQGQALFAALAAAIPDHAVLLIGTMRHGVPAQWRADLERFAHTRLLSLTRLGARDVHRLLADAMGSQAVVGEVATKVAMASDGNPYFLFEILRGLREQGILSQTSSGVWVTTGAVRELKIPSSVEDLLRARLAELDPADRAFLEVAACLGLEFDPLLVAAALGEAPIPALQRLARLESATRLVRAKGRRFVFDHGQVKEALYEGISELLREQYHALLGSTLEAQTGAGGTDPATLPGDLAASLARHFLLGVEPARAVRYVDRATQHLEGTYSHDLAAELAARALGVDGLYEGETRVDLLLAQAWRLDHLGRRDAQRQAIDEAAALAQGLGDPRRSALAERALGSLLWRIGEAAAARDVIARGIRSAEAAGDRRELAALHGNLGSTYWSLGEYAAAIEEHSRALEMGRELGIWSIEANALGGMGNAYWALGRHEDARAMQAQWLSLAREHGDRVGEAMAEGNLGGALRFLGRLEEARPHIERSLELAQQIGHPSVAANAAMNLGGLCAELGYSAESIHALEAAERLLQEIRYRESEGIVHGMLGLAWLEVGAHDRARACYARSAEICEEISDRRNLGYALLGQGLLAEQQEDRALARERYDQTVALWDEIAYLRGLGWAHLLRGALRAKEGQREGARADLEAALERGRESGQHGNEVQALAHLALLDGGPPDPVLRAFEEHAACITTTETMSVRFLLWKLTQDRSHLEDAKRILDHLVEHAPAECRTSMLEKVPHYREIRDA